jgi:hypothetical protein
MIDRRTINGFPVHYVAAALLQAGRRRGPGKSPLLPIATNDEAVDRDPALACAIPVMPYSMHSLHTLDELKQRESWLKASVDAMIGLLHRYVCMERLENACFFCLLFKYRWRQSNMSKCSHICRLAFQDLAQVVPETC